MNEALNLTKIEERKYKRIGIIVLIALALIVGVWGIMAPLSSTVSASGKVVVASNNRLIQHLEGGIIRAIPVKDGDHVQAGQLLIELDDTRANAELQIALSQYIEMLAQEARLIAERDRSAAITFSPEMDDLCRINPCSTLRQGQINEFHIRSDYLKSQDRILSQRIDQLNSQLSGLKDTIEANTRLSVSYTQEINEWKILFDQQLTDKLHLREIERQKIKTDSEIAGARADIIRINAQIGELKTQILSQRQNFDKEVTEKLSEAQTKLSDLHLQITALKDTLSRTRILSPVEGTVTALQFHTLGGVIPSGKSIMEIVPSGEQLIIEGLVPATEIGNIHSGMKAEIRFPGFTHIKTLGIVEGKLIHIAADAISNETTHVLYYPIKIAVTRDGIKELSRNHLSIQSGIPADVMIVTGSRTMLDYLIHPFKTMLTKSFNEQ